MQDIATETGVSQTTVSMILNHRYGAFPKETVDRVLQTAEQMGYTFRRRKTESRRNVVMVLVTSVANPWYTDMIQSIDEAAIENMIQVVTVCTYHNPSIERQALQTAVDSSYMGVIFLYPPDDLQAYEAAREQITIVAFCNRLRYIKGDCIQIGSFEAGSLAAQHLIGLGHKKIAVITTSRPGETTSDATRLAGITAEVEKSLSKDSLLIIPDRISWQDMMDDHNVQYSVGYRMVQSERIRKEGVTAIICTNDLIAYGAMDWLTANGFRIPEDLSVIGVDDLRCSGMPQIGLTTVNLHMDAAARAAFSTLMNRSMLQKLGRDAAKAPRQQVHCDVSIIIRSSTGPAGDI